MAEWNTHIWSGLDISIAFSVRSLAWMAGLACWFIFCWVTDATLWNNPPGCVSTLEMGTFIQGPYVHMYNKETHLNPTCSITDRKYKIAILYHLVVFNQWFAWQWWMIKSCSRFVFIYVPIDVYNAFLFVLFYWNFQLNVYFYLGIFFSMATIVLSFTVYLP